MSESSGLLAAEGAFAGVVAKEQETYRTILEAGVARLRELGLEPVAELRVGEPGHGSPGKWRRTLWSWGTVAAAASNAGGELARVFVCWKASIAVC